MRNIFTFCLFLSVVYTAHAQRFQNAQFLTSFSSTEISAALGIPASYGVDLYKVVYLTPDFSGQDHQASGLICIPQAENTSFPLVCYQHGTVNGRNDVPSNLEGGYQLALALSAFGYVTCAADFVGLGDSPGIHGYVHAATEATAGVDLLLAAREMSEDENYPPFYVHDQLFIGGYSQGGHASMAAHRLIESEYTDEFNIAGCAHMSGPYSISEKMVEFTLGDMEYQTVSYLPWLALSYKAAYPELLKDYEIEDFFKAEYLDDIYLFRDETIGLSELNSRLSQKLIANVGGVIPKNMLKEDILNAILTDPTHPFSVALADNDTYDWAPESRTNIYYCEGDDQVTFENAVLAEAVMKSNGSSTVLALQMDPSFPFDHGQCISPTLTSVVFFFGSLQQTLTSTDEILAQNQIKTYTDGIQLVTEIPFSGDQKNRKLQVFNSHGQLVLAADCEAGMKMYDIVQLEPGMYFVNIYDNRGLIHANKFFKN